MAKKVSVVIDVNADNAAKSVDNLNDEIKETGVEALNTKQKLAELEDQLADMSDQGSEEFKKMAKEAGEYKRQIDASTAAIDIQAKEFPKLQLGTEVFGALAGGAGLVLAGMSALGIENETVSKGIERMMTVTTALTSVQAIADSLSEKSLLGQKARAVLNEASVLFKKKDVLLTNAQAVSTAGLTTAEGTATTAQWSLNAAMSANPIMLVVVALTALVGGMYAYGQSINNLPPTETLFANDEEIKKSKETISQLQDEMAVRIANGEDIAEITMKINKGKKIQAKLSLKDAQTALRQAKITADAYKNSEQSDEKEHLVKLAREKVNYYKAEIKGTNNYIAQVKKVKDDGIQAELDAAETDRLDAIKKTKDEERKAKLIATNDDIAQLKVNAIKDDELREINQIELTYKKRISEYDKNITSEAIAIELLKTEMLEKELAISTKYYDEGIIIAEEKSQKDFEIAQSLSEDKISLLEIEMSLVEEKGELETEIKKSRFDIDKALLKNDLDTELITLEEYTSKLDVIQKAFDAKEKAAAVAQAAFMTELQQKKLNATISVVNAASNIFNEMSSIEQQRINDSIGLVQDESTAKQEILKQQLENDLITQREFDLATQKDNAKTAAIELKLRREAFESKKKTDIISTTINTATAVASQLSAGPTGFILAALAAAMGAIQIAKISSSTFKAAQGGIVPGTPSNVDSVNSLLAPGEIVINSNSAQMFGQELSAINQAGGGSIIPTNIGSGGNSKSTPIVKAYVVETEISESQKGVNKIEELATF